MKHLKLTTGLLLLGLVSCSSYKTVTVSHDHPEAAERGIAGQSKKRVSTENELKDRLTELTTGVFQSYLYGQVLLQKFDQKLEENPETALDSKEYDRLQAIRVLVDGFEDQIGEYYVQMVLTTALPDSTDDQKRKAETALKTLADFVAGARTNGDQLPENLRPLILGNLMTKQLELYEELKKFHDDDSFTKGDKVVKDAIRRHMLGLRATRNMEAHALKNYQVDQAEVDKAIEEESKKQSFKDFKKQVKRLAQEINEFQKELKAGRSTSSDVFFPSTGSAGNITGNGFTNNTWTLTYDDGPAGSTPGVLAELQKRGLKATFFVLAKQAETYKTVIKNLTDAGMDMASHSYTHAQLTKLSAAGLQKEIVASKGVIESKTGKTVKLFRLPYGAGVNNAAIRQLIAGQNMIHVFWNVDSLDWQDKNVQSIANRVATQMKGKKGGVILFHDIHVRTIEASAKVMDHLKSVGAKVCTTQGIVDQINKNLPSCQ